MRKRKTLLDTLLSLLILFLLIFIFVIVTNFDSIKKISMEHNYRKNNARLLMYGLTSTFNAWDNNIDTSDGYYISKTCTDNFGNIDSTEGYNKINNASKNNIILGNIKATGKKTIFINECILLKDIKVLYLTYNTLFSHKDKIIRISLLDSRGNNIANEPSFIDIKKGLFIRNTENFFWGIDFDQYQSINLHIEVYSADFNYLYEYDQLLFQK